MEKSLSIEFTPPTTNIHPYLLIPEPPLYLGISAVCHVTTVLAENNDSHCEAIVNPHMLYRGVWSWLIEYLSECPLTTSDAALLVL